MEIAYVSEGSAAIARNWERMFQILPPEAGILFVSVQPVAIEGGLCHVYDVTLGLNKNRGLEQETGIAMMRQVLKEDIANDLFKIRCKVFLGVAGADGDNSKTIDTLQKS
jgi:hypothetical protein